MAGGAPLGNQNGAKAKRWSAAIERALSRKGVDAQQQLDAMADAFVSAVLAGDKDAIPGWKEFGDRMEGKPAQSMTLAGDSEAPLTVSLVNYAKSSIDTVQLQ